MFLQKFPPPWATINSIFQKHDIKYSFEEISPENFIENIPIDFKLIKNSTGKRIEFSNLSSGEKTIIALIVRLFPVSYYGKELENPELIVLDEPDSHLHPELSKLLIDVLSDTFVNDLGIKVIMTTHSIYRLIIKIIGKFSLKAQQMFRTTKLFMMSFLLRKNLTLSHILSPIAKERETATKLTHL